MCLCLGVHYLNINVMAASGKPLLYFLSAHQVSAMRYYTSNASLPYQFNHINPLTTNEMLLETLSALLEMSSCLLAASFYMLEIES